MKYYTKIALQHLAMGLIIPVAIIWKMQNGLSISEAVLTESVVLFVTAVADLPAGFIANIINNKRSLVIGAFLHLAAMILLFIGGSLLTFTVAAAVTGMAWAFVSGADEAYLHDDFIDDKSMYRKHFSNATIFDEAFTIIGMLLASLVIYLKIDIRLLFLFSAVLLFVHFFYTWLLLPQSKAKIASTHPAYLSNNFTRATLMNKQLMPAIHLMLAFAVIYEAGRALWQPHLQAIGFNIADFGVLFALFKIAAICGSVLSRQRTFKLPDLVLVFALMTVSLIGFGLSFKTLSIMALCVYLFTENYFRVYMSTVLNEAISDNRAAVLSLGSVIRNGAGALIVAGMGVLSSASILLAFAILVVIKLPAIIYTLRAYALAARG